MQIVFALFLYIFAACAAFEGDGCVQDGVNSVVCIGISQCPSALEDLKQRRFSKNCGSAPSGEPLVCCVQRDITTTTKPARTTVKRSTSRSSAVTPAPGAVAPASPCGAVPAAFTAPSNGRKAWDKCLEYQERLVFPCSRGNTLLRRYRRNYICHHDADELIIGGANAVDHEFPHMALIGFGSEPEPMQWSCGGALISDRFVLTAAHCSSWRNESASQVVVGKLLRSDTENATNWHKVKRVIRHPQYCPPQRYHDIALLELEQPVPLDQFTVPACLYTGAAADVSRASATGWGLTQHNTMRTAEVLQKVILSKFPTAECTSMFSSYRLLERGFDGASQICYGDRTRPKDTCQGDSGGPLQVKSDSMACMYYVVGVTSAGRGCGAVARPAVYTRVQHYLAWIEGVVWP